MIRTGETHVSHVALLAPKITEANCQLVMREIKGKTKREVGCGLARPLIQAGGNPAQVTASNRPGIQPCRYAGNSMLDA